MAMLLIVPRSSRPSRDPWNETHLVIDTIEPWTIRLDRRNLGAGVSERSTRA